MGEKLVLWRDLKTGKIGCARDVCAHRGAALSIGKIIDQKIQCPFHGFQYDTTGECCMIPAIGKNTNVPERFKILSYPVKDAYGFIWLWWGEKQENYPQLPFFEDLKAGFTFSSFADPWITHYSRAIENQLDVVHLPFVHHNTIGRGGRTLVHGPKVKWNPKENLLNVWYNNVIDDGKSKALRADEMPEPTMKPLVHFKFPNIWMLRTSDAARIMVAFAPVDEENTVLYVRFYQKSLKLPLLRSLVNWFGIRGSKIIVNQDRKVVITQKPKKSELQSKELLIPGDLPIVTYRRERQRLIDESLSN